jgi:uncharacterized protein
MLIDGALIAAAALLGLGGIPHCAAMCGAASTGLVRPCTGARTTSGWIAFVGARTTGYATAGAVAASAVSLLGLLGQAAPWVRGLWSAFHAAALVFGLWLVATGRQPRWMRRAGVATPIDISRLRGAGAAPALRAAAAGAMWVALPCGLLQSALVVAALAGDPVGGAAAMAAFALTSSIGLLVLPAVVASRNTRVAAARGSAWAVRLAGVALAAGSGWALGHGLWERVAAYCSV